MFDLIYLDLRASIYISFIPRAIILSFSGAIIAAHVRTKYSHANKRAGRKISERQEKEKEKAIDKPTKRRQAICG